MPRLHDVLKSPVREQAVEEALPEAPAVQVSLRVAIVGSRGFRGLDVVEHYVGLLAPDTVVVSGGAVGVDLTAENAARARGLVVVTHRPDPNRGIPGLFERNTTIVSDANVVVAFQGACQHVRDGRACARGGWSHGTADTIEKAARLGKLGWVYRVGESGRATFIDGRAYRA